MTLRSPARHPRGAGVRRARHGSVLVAVLGAVALSLVPGAASAAPGRTNLATGATVSGSSSYESERFGWAARHGADGVTGSSQPSMGWSSDNTTGADHSEWFQLDLGTTASLDQVVLWPRDDAGNAGYGFPVEATVATSVDGTTWTPVWTTSDSSLSTAARTGTFAAQTARYVRITGKSLRANPADGNRYRMQFAEVEVYGTASTASPTPAPTTASPATVSPTTAPATTSAGPTSASDTVTTTRRSLTPLADCYTANSNGSYTVVLGYTNPRSASVTIPVGPSNTFNPATYNSSLPTTFEPGTRHGVASVTVAAADASSSLSWTLDGTTLGYATDTPVCSTSQLPMLANGAAVVGVVVFAGIFGALVLRRQRRITEGADGRG